jgi:hypothetical protein
LDAVESKAKVSTGDKRTDVLRVDDTCIADE